MQDEIGRFARFAGARIASGQAVAAEMGQEHARQLALAGLGEPPPGVTVMWARLPREAVVDLIGFLHDGSPLRTLLDELGPEASAAVRQALVTGVATGQSPRTVARWIREGLGGNLVRALTISRTEMLRSYRESSRRSYRANSDVVESWVRHEACDQRTCPLCWALHGKEYPLKERFATHPRCRGTLLPKTRSWRDILGEKGAGIPETRVSVEPGPSRFARLPEAEQMRVLGPAKFAAWRDGAIGWEDIPGFRRDPKWGPVGYERGLRDILGAEKAAGYLDPVRRAAAQKAAATRAAAMGGGLPVLGADVHRLAALQETRLAQLHEMTTAQVDDLMRRMAAATDLPRPAYHFRRHGALLGASSQEGYVALFREHIQRQDLAMGTALRPKDRARMWYLLGVDTRTVAQYNESAGSYWSFMKVASLEAYLRDASVWWVRARRVGTEWRFEPWTL